MNIRRWLRNKRIGVLYGGMSAEREISLASGKAVIAAFRSLGISVVPIDVGRDAAAQIRRAKIDFAYITLHGPWGEDGTIQGMLEIMGIPYSGCGVLASALAMDKIFSKRVFDAEKIPSAPWQAYSRGERVPSPKKFPVVVKPATQGSAIGVSIPENEKEFRAALAAAFKLDERVLVETYIRGTEITVGVLGDTALPAVEIVPVNKFYDFDAKYTKGKSQHIIPPRLPQAVLRRAGETALRTFRALGCRAVSRIDMIVDRSGKPWVLEVNTLPGMTETSLLPDEARAAGMSFGDMLLKIIEHSLEK